WHPESLSVSHNGFMLFDRDPAFLAEVRGALETAYASGRRQHGVMANLANVLAHRVIPPRHETEADHQQWLRYFGLPPDHPLPTVVDVERANMAARFYREAMTAADAEGWPA